MSHTKFVILSESRSGTTHLASMLNLVKGVSMLGEIFHPREWNQMSRRVRAVRPSFMRSIAFMDEVLSQCPRGKTHVGFKMWRSQAPGACHRALQDESILKIVLDRENRLASYSSLYKALTTGVWNITQEDRLAGNYERRLIDTFDSIGVLEHVIERDALYGYYRKNSVGRTLNISYSGLLAGEDYDRCMEFLGLEPLAGRPSEHRRLNSGAILSRFAESERAEVVRTLAELGHPEWAGSE